MRKELRDQMIRLHNAHHWFGRWTAQSCWRNGISGERLAHVEQLLFQYDAVSWQAYLDQKSRLNGGNA